MKKIGPYEIVELLGRGAMGEVYKAIDSKMHGRLVAVKVLSEQLSRSKQALVRFEREIEVAAKLNHPNIVTIHDRGVHEGRHYFVMEHIDGIDLSVVIQGQEERKIEWSMEIACQVAEALECAHGHGMIHRDIKPSNIMIARGAGQDRAKIVDFGIVRVELSDLTQTASQPGTNRYMAPEQLNNDPVDHRSDLFSFGIVLYELFTGVHPFEAASLFLTSRKILESEPLPPKNLVPSMPGSLDSLILKVLEKDPALRPQTTREVADALRQILRRYQSRGVGSDAGDYQDVDELTRPMIENLVRFARSKEAEGDAQSAIRALEKAAGLAPEVERIQRKLQKLKHRVEAEKKLEDHLSRARAALAEGQLDDAKQHVKDAWILSPESEGVTALENEIEQAARLQSEIQAQAKEREEQKRARRQRAAELEQEARESFRLAAECEETRPAEAGRARDAYVRSRTAYSKLQKEDPGNAEVPGRLREIKAAIERLDRILEEREARARQIHNELQDARRILQERGKLHHADEAELSRYLDQMDAGRGRIDRVLELDPGHAEALKLLESYDSLAGAIKRRLETLYRTRELVEQELRKGRELMEQANVASVSKSPKELKLGEKVCRRAERAFQRVLAADGNQKEAREAVSDLESLSEHYRSQIQRYEEDSFDREEQELRKLRTRVARKRVSQGLEQAGKRAGGDRAALQQGLEECKQAQEVLEQLETDNPDSNEVLTLRRRHGELARKLELRLRTADSGPDPQFDAGSATRIQKPPVPEDPRPIEPAEAVQGQVPKIQRLKSELPSSPFKRQLVIAAGVVALIAAAIVLVSWVSAWHNAREFLQARESLLQAAETARTDATEPQVAQMIGKLEAFQSQHPDRDLTAVGASLESLRDLWDQLRRTPAPVQPEPTPVPLEPTPSQPEPAPVQLEPAPVPRAGEALLERLVGVIQSTRATVDDYQNAIRDGEAFLRKHPDSELPGLPERLSDLGAKKQELQKADARLARSSRDWIGKVQQLLGDARGDTLEERLSKMGPRHDAVERFLASNRSLANRLGTDLDDLTNLDQRLADRMELLRLVQGEKQAITGLMKRIEKENEPSEELIDEGKTRVESAGRLMGGNPRIEWFGLEDDVAGLRGAMARLEESGQQLPDDWKGFWGTACDPKTGASLGGLTVTARHQFLKDETPSVQTNDDGTYHLVLESLGPWRELVVKNAEGTEERFPNPHGIGWKLTGSPRIELNLCHE